MNVSTNPARPTKTPSLERPVIISDFVHGLPSVIVRCTILAEARRRERLRHRHSDSRADSAAAEIGDAARRHWLRWIGSQPRPTNGIAVAMIVIDRMFAASGRVAMVTMASATF